MTSTSAAEFCDWRSGEIFSLPAHAVAVVRTSDNQRAPIDFVVFLILDLRLPPPAGTPGTTVQNRSALMPHTAVETHSAAKPHTAVETHSAGEEGRLLPRTLPISWFWFTLLSVTAGRRPPALSSRLQEVEALEP